MEVFKVVDLYGNEYRIVEPENYIQELYNPYNKYDYFGCVVNGKFKCSKKLMKKYPSITFVIK